MRTRVRRILSVVIFKMVEEIFTAAFTAAVTNNESALPGFRMEKKVECLSFLAFFWGGA